MSEYTGKKISSFQARFSELCNADPRNDSGIAAALHVSRQTVHYWKLGERSPKTPTVIAIADYFGVDVAWLMGFDVEKFDHPKETKETESLKTVEARILAQGIDNMPREKREQALNIMKTIFIDYADFFNKGEKDDDNT